MSKLPFELLLALRYLRPKRTFVSIITLISIAGVALGVAVLIIVISVMSGFDRDLRQKIIGFNAHLRITVPDSTMADYGRLMSIVSSNREVRGVAPYVLGPVLVQTEPANTNAQDVREAAPFVRGVDARHEADVSVLPSSIIDGTFDLSGDSVIVGSDFARQLDLNVGDRLEIYSPADLERMRRQRGSEAVLPNDYTVTGIFDVGYYDFDADVIVTSLENAQDLFNLDDRVHGLMVMLRDPYQADAARDALMKTLGARYSIATWMEENHTILS
ncbi:MAG: ABC transporter permease, partial [Verrucomicrobia bacterium]|nr:ABC transporter permease [Verrucomicrobiota bacterium]